MINLFAAGVGILNSPLVTPKASYRLFCDSEPSIPLSSQAWWLDATAGKEFWDVAIVQNNGRIVASMPYYLRRRFGRVFIGQPLLTQTLGPWIHETDAKQASRMEREKALMEQLLAKLPKYDYFQQNWHYERKNWLPFYWAGFNQTTRYTYILQPIQDLEAVWEGFSSAYRNKVRKAQKVVTVRIGMSIDDFYQINALTFHRQGITVPYSSEFLRAHDAAIAARGQRQIFSAHDRDGRVHSALYLTWDRNSAYVHMVGEDPALRSSGAGILLIWEAIRYSSEILKLNCFDFEGSMIESVERVRRNCGAKQVPYFSVSRTPSRFIKIMGCLRSILR